MAGDINYSIIDNEGIKVIKIAGNISASNRSAFENLIKRLSDRNNVILNMQGVDIVTSAGIDSLLEVARHAKKVKGKLMFMGVREELRKLFDEMEIRQNFVFIDSIEEGQSRIYYY